MRKNIINVNTLISIIILLLVTFMIISVNKNINSNTTDIEKLNKKYSDIEFDLNSKLYNLSSNYVKLDDEFKSLKPIDPYYKLENEADKVSVNTIKLPLNKLIDDYERNKGINVDSLTTIMEYVPESGITISGREIIKDIMGVIEQIKIILESEREYTDREDLYEEKMDIYFDSLEHIRNSIEDL